MAAAARGKGFAPKPPIPAGTKIGRLTVEEWTGEKKGKPGFEYRIYTCTCECGELHKVGANGLYGNPNHGGRKKCQGRRRSALHRNRKHPGGWEGKVAVPTHAAMPGTTPDGWVEPNGPEGHRWPAIDELRDAVVCLKCGRSADLAHPDEHCAQRPPRGKNVPHRTKRHPVEEGALVSALREQLAARTQALRALTLLSRAVIDRVGKYPAKRVPAPIRLAVTELELNLDNPEHGRT